MTDSTNADLERQAKLYRLGFFGFCACEVVVNIIFIAKIRELFNSGPEDLFMIAMFAYMVLSVVFGAGILYFLYQSKRIQMEIGKGRWTI